MNELEPEHDDADAIAGRDPPGAAADGVTAVVLRLESHRQSVDCLPLRVHVPKWGRAKKDKRTNADTESREQEQLRAEDESKEREQKMTDRTRPQNQNRER